MRHAPAVHPTLAWLPRKDLILLNAWAGMRNFREGSSIHDEVFLRIIKSKLLQSEKDKKDLRRWAPSGSLGAWRALFRGDGLAKIANGANAV